MPPDAAARSAVMADTMLPAAPVTRNTVSLVESHSGSAVCHRLFLKADRPTKVVLVADLDRSRIVECFCDQCVGNLRRVATRLEINRFDGCVRALALEGLGKSHDGAAERSRCSHSVVPMLSTQASRRDQEPTRASNLLVQSSSRSRTAT